MAAKIRMAETGKRRALGRGLDALLPAAPETTRSSENLRARVEELHPQKQPRTRFADASLDALAVSLKEKGMLGPILVRKRARGGYEIVAGERRWRAAQRAGLPEVPIVVRELSDTEAFEAALIENLQREDLNPLEVARAFQGLIDEHQHNQDSIARLIGKDRSTVANALRLLKLPGSLLDLIEEGELSEGHGRALLGAGETALMERLARQAVRKRWSVRETERRVRSAALERDPGKRKRTGKNANVRDLEERLTRSMGTRVTVADRKGRGHLKISFSSYDELDRLLEVLLGD
jgi:ParB family chromosome partitioning protein